uniref:Head scaffolding protein n=1 Tax=Ochrobactrum phage ORM_20 TaxID=2985243 RepID=A0A9N6WZP6_9VIRU|nr:head scaffolding protein [Ochrobactrum phage ORM_20]
MLKALKVDESELATFKDILRGAINESVNRTTRKAVKKARSIIVKEANERIREATARKKAAIKQVNEISARAYKRFEESHAEELKKLAQFDEMVSLLKGVHGVMESFGLALAPANKKLKLQLENARKAHAREVASLNKENARLATEAERLKIRTSLEKLAKPMTESERSEFIAIIGEMKVESHADFIARATKVRDRLYKEGKSEYNSFVEQFAESQTVIDPAKKPKPVTESRKPRNIMEASMEVLSGL